MSEHAPDVRTRNAARTRELVLDAAEQLFAERGYEATSLQEVGARAGVSRGTPSYFYRAKADLYRAVLERCFQQVRDAVRAGRERALRSGEPPEVVVEGAVGDYFDFLVARPHFLRLVEREALGDGPGAMGEVAQLAIGQEMLEAIASELGLDSAPSGDASQLLLSIISLCWFPLIHARTVAPLAGVDCVSPAALERRKRHVVALVKGAWPALTPTSTP
ncbi:MAG: TetR/AcrR family transcriptional regulator [Gemmatimonadales bacterium]|jgi:AcrR family transcriptional regulator|nr:TetR/AcrR family transcriptional regulator [Gemmatimonadales bacterium]